MGQKLHGDGVMKNKWLGILDCFKYPRRGFEVILWVIIVAWIGLGLGVSYNLWYWQMDMTHARQELQEHIMSLQEIIKNHGRPD